MWLWGTILRYDRRIVVTLPAFIQRAHQIEPLHRALVATERDVLCRSHAHLLIHAIPIYRPPSANSASNELWHAFGVRFITGFVGSPVLATSGATVADIYAPKKRAYGLTINTRNMRNKFRIRCLNSSESLAMLEYSFTNWCTLKSTRCLYTYP